MKVLLVEDEATLREGMAELISELAEVREAATVKEAVEALAAERFSLVLTDLRIANAERGGRDILEEARRRLQPVIIISAAAAEEVAHSLSPLAPDAVLAKPFQLEELMGSVERFLTLRRETERLALARELPPEAEWTEVAPGVRVAGSSGPSGRALTWVRMEPGASIAWRTWQAAHQAPEGAFVLEGDVEVAGEPRTTSQYLFLAPGPREVRTRQGCLLVSLALGD